MAKLYHYTNSAGLIGIVQSRSFWASEYRFLNDATEFAYGWNILLQILREHDSDIRAINSDVATIVGDLCANAMKTDSFYGFVVSLTTEGDLLSQWRGYNGGKGFAIGIDEDALVRNAMTQEFSMFEVLYDQNKQHKSAINVVRLLMKMTSDAKRYHGGEEPRRLKWLVLQWWRHALKAVLSFKNEHFREEHERRLAFIGETWPQACSMRTGPRGLVPYMPCFFNQDPSPSASSHPANHGLMEIIIGPALQDTQKLAVDALLAKNGMRFEVRMSDIPYVAD